MTTAIHRPCGTEVVATPENTYELVEGRKVWVRTNCPTCCTPFNVHIREATPMDMNASWHYLPVRVFRLWREFQHVTAPRSVVNAYDR